MYGHNDYSIDPTQQTVDKEQFTDDFDKKNVSHEVFLLLFSYLTFALKYTCKSIRAKSLEVPRTNQIEEKLFLGREHEKESYSKKTKSVTFLQEPALQDAHSKKSLQ